MAIIHKPISANNVKNGTVSVLNTKAATTKIQNIDTYVSNSPTTGTINTYLNDELDETIIYSKAIDVTVGTGVIVPLVAGRAIKVTNISYSTSAAATVELRSSGTTIVGPVALAANGVYAPNGSPNGIFKTAIGEPLVLVRSAGNVRGVVSYKLV